MASEPQLRPAATTYIAGLVGLAIVLVALLLPRTPAPAPDRLLLAAVFIGCMTLASLFPLPFTFRTKFHVDTAVTFASILLFHPAIAMLVVGCGVLAAEALRPGPRDLPQSALNTAQVVLQAAIGGLLLRLAGYTPEDPAFGRPAILLALPVAAVALHLANVLAVATVVALQDGLPVRSSWVAAVTEDLRAEALALVSLAATGLLAAIVVDARPWAVILLAAPVIGTYLTLQHHVRLRQEADAHRRSSDAGLAEAQRIAHLGSWEWDLETDRHRWSDETFRILGLPAGSPVPSRAALFRRIVPEDRPRVEAALQRTLASLDPLDVEHRIRRPDGSERTVQQRGEIVTPADRSSLRLVATIYDVTERKSLEALLRHRASHDPLTGLPNRALLAERLEAVLTDPTRADGQLAVLFLDLDNFKLVNDSRGHEAGDQLLRAVAGRLRTCVGDSGTIARFGGDEFVVLLEAVPAASAVESLARRLLDTLGPIPIAGEETFVNASIGIAVGRPHRFTPSDLLRAADTALYRAKAAGRGTFALYEPAMHPPVVQRLERETALRRAVDGGELRLHYQPIVALGVDRVVGVEALLRWQHPTHGLLPPDDFIRLAEETGTIVPLGRWAMEEGCRQLRAWQDAVPEAPPLWIAVNLSARHFQDADLLDDVRHILSWTNLTPDRLEVEITESALIGEMTTTRRTLAALREMGVRVAIDDFGTGYSSLVRLRDLNPDTLKIDRSFVARLDRDAGEPAIVRAATTLAHDLGLTVTAEGVETAEQAAILHGLGVDYAQGYYFAAPADAETTLSLLTRAVASARAPGPILENEARVAPGFAIS